MLSYYNAKALVSASVSYTRLSEHEGSAVGVSNRNKCLYTRCCYNILRVAPPPFPSAYIITDNTMTVVPIIMYGQRMLVL